MRARPFGLVVLWASVTAVLTVTTWLAVEVVADEVAGQRTRVLTAAAVRAAADEPAAPNSPATTPEPISSAPAIPSPTAKARPARTPSPTKTKDTPSPSPSPSRAQSKPTPTPTPTPTTGGGGSGSTVVSKTFSIQGGTVAAGCSGAKVSLQSAQPKNGWAVEVHERGPEQLEISFRSGEAETEVSIRCSAGKPVIETHGDDESDD